MRQIPSSELIVNTDGSVFHLHLRPGEVADTVLLVGDPARSDMISRYFDTIEHSASNREFRSHTGTIGRRRLSVVSTGIGCDNIDIVVTELDALLNVDFESRTARRVPQPMTLLRLGTSGALQPDIEIGQMVRSDISGGLDGLLNFYAGATTVSDGAMEQAFVEQTAWGERLARPYFVHNDAVLSALFDDCTIRGLTLSAPGFYAPQGRVVRLPLAAADYLDRIERFEYHGTRVTNLEMESSAIAALAAMMGHRALTICTIIAQRNAGASLPDYDKQIRKMVEMALEKITK